MGRSHAGTHEQDNVLMPGLPVVHHLLLKELQVIWVGPVNLQEANGNLTVPATLVYLPPSTLNKHKVVCLRCVNTKVNILCVLSNIECVCVT